MKRRATRDEFGRLTSPEDAVMAEDMPLDLTEYYANARDDDNTALWSYLNEGKINGVPVDSADRNLKIDSGAMLQVAFAPVREPRSLLLYMSPDDKESQNRYDEVMRKAYAGEVILVDEQKQFDPGSCRFIVWLRYDEVHYALHPRFGYLREE